MPHNLASAPYVVFSSATGAELDVGHWDEQAARFFASRLTLLGQGGDGEARILVEPSEPNEEAAGERLLSARPRSEQDLAQAEAAELRAGGGGMVLVARRCHTVWLVERYDEKDRVALRLAMILASVLLGPILDVHGPELFGVKTARTKLG